MFRKLFKRKAEVAPVLVVQNHELTRTLNELVGVFGDGMVAHHTGSSFSCWEADVIARALVIAGDEDAAVTWLSGHAQGDEWDDYHFVGNDDDPEDEGRVMTDQELTEYVANWAQVNA